MQTDPLRGFLSIFSAKIGTLLLTLLITPILVRVLGSTQYGQYAFLLSLFGVSMIFINAGINDGVRKFVAEDRSSRDWASNVFGFYTRLGSLLAGIGVIIFIFLNISGLTALLIGSEFESYLYLIAFLIVGRQYFIITRSALMGKGLEHISEPLKVIRTAIFGIIGLALAIGGYGVSGILAGDIIASFLVTGLGLYYISKQYDIHLIIRPTIENLPRRELISFNSYTIVLIFLTSSLYHVDILLLQPFSGSTATGYYKAALVIAEFLWLVPTALQNALLHSTSEIWSKQNMSDITGIATCATRYTLVFTLLLAIGLAALADPFLPLYFGDEFTAAITPLWLLLPGAVGFAIARPIFAIGQGKGDLQPLIVATSAAAVINLVLNLILIPSYGMAGAAIATSIGYGSMVGFHGLAARRIGYDPFVDLRLLQILVTAALATPVIFGLAYIIGPRILSLLIVPPVGFMVYLMFTLRTRAIASEEIIPLLERAPSPLAKWSIKVLIILDG